MSEPSQLYARLRMSRPKLDEFFASDFRIEIDEPLMAWLDAASYYGERLTRENVRERATDYATVREWVDTMISPGIMGFPMPSRNEYDDETQTWTLGVLDFSENYDDYIAAVAVLREAAKFKDIAGEDGLLVYGYMFENGGVAVALEVGIGSSRFLCESEAEPLVREADAVMEALLAQGAATAGDDA